MAEDEVVIARIVGDELRIERYQCRQRSVSSITCPEARLESRVRQLRPHLVVWTAPDARGRRLAAALKESDPQGEQRPGCIELPAWTDLEVSELLRMTWQPETEESEQRPQEEMEAESVEGPLSESGAGPAAPAEEVGPAKDERDELGERLDLVLAVRAKRPAAPRRKGEETGG
ncbi:MAG: hypothetical protein JSV79_02685 [Armatimonadota bacterium]|nr:MAG: hypothetical protein JSV79_02685 [Armatimonadota bacterium]